MLPTNEQLIAYIRGEFARGVDRSDVIQALLSNNWKIEDINAALATIDAVPSQSISVVPGAMGTMTKVALWIFGVVIVAGAGVGIWLWQQSTQSASQLASERLSTTTTETIHDTSIQNGITMNVNAKIDVTTTASCGTPDCFQQKFEACQSATLDADAEFVSVHYKIISAIDSNYCRVSFTYTKNPNPDWVGKEMTCTFPTHLSDGIEKQVGDVIAYSAAGGKGNPNECEGSLYSLLQPVQAVADLAAKATSDIGISNLNYTSISITEIKNYIGKMITFNVSNPETGMKFCADSTRVKTSGVVNVTKDDVCVYNRPQSGLFTYNEGTHTVSAALFPHDTATADTATTQFMRDEIDHYDMEFYVQDSSGKQSNRLKFTITK